MGTDNLVLRGWGTGRYPFSDGPGLAATFGARAADGCLRGQIGPMDKRIAIFSW